MGQLLLLTGATGFIGFRTLLYALKAGWNVRAAARSESKATQIENTPAIKALNLPSSALTFAVVPDITAPGAYSEAIEGVTHVIHIAASIPTQNVDGHKNSEEVFIKPAVRGAQEILNAAKASQNVVKVVITSSIVALMPPNVFGGSELSDERYTAYSRIPSIPGPYENPEVAYCASKIASLNETDAWVKREKPSFDIVNVHPGWVLGPADHVRSREEFRKGTNLYLMGVALGRPQDFYGERRLSSGTIHVEDVARVHVLALNSNVTGYRDFTASVTGIWQDVADYVAKHFQSAVKDGVFRTDAKQPTAKLNLDGEDTEKFFNIKFRSFTQMIDETLKHYLSLPEKV